MHISHKRTSTILLTLLLLLITVAPAFADGDHNTGASISSTMVIVISAVGALLIAGLISQLLGGNLLLAGLVGFTAVVHLLEGVRFGFLPMLFLNGIGYLALIAGLYLDIDLLKTNRRLLKLALLGYSIVTIVAYVAIHGTHVDLLGILTKLVEVGIIILLAQQLRG